MAEIRDGAQAEEVRRSHQKPIPRGLEVQGDADQAEGRGALLHRQGEVREGRRRRGTVVLKLIFSPGGFQLALRAGNEKEEGETADTVGCCSLRVEHIKLYPEIDGQEFVVEFDFLGKDSIRYYNKVPVEKRVPVLPFLFISKCFISESAPPQVSPASCRCLGTFSCSWRTRSLTMTCLIASM